MTLRCHIKNLFGKFGLFILESIVIFYLLIISVWLRNILVSVPDIEMAVVIKYYWWIPVVYILFLLLQGFWGKQRTFWEEWELNAKVALLALLVNYTLVTVAHSQDVISRLALFLFWILTIMVVPLVRYILKGQFFYRLLIRRVLFLGDTNIYQQLKKAFTYNRYLGMQIVEHNQYDKYGIDIQNTEWEKQVDTIVKAAQQIAERVRSKCIQSVILQSPFWGHPIIDTLAEFLTAYGVNVMIVPRYISYIPRGGEAYHLMYENLILIEIPKGVVSNTARFLKRVMDVVLGIVFLIIASPLLLLTAFLTWIGDGRPVLYVAPRFGYGGKLFNFYKFRYMLKSTSFDPEKEKRMLEELFKSDPELAEHWKIYRKLPIDRDPRIIPKTGKIIAKLNLSELAQIFNVLKGDMSIVGPRPYLPSEKKDIGPYFDRIHIVKPGITGLWTVLGGNARTFKERLEIDSWYARNWSIWLDIKIILKTIIIVIRKFFDR